MSHQQPYGYPVPTYQTQVVVQHTYAPPEQTRVDPFGAEPTQQLPRSPWEPDHRR